MTWGRWLLPWSLVNPCSPQECRPLTPALSREYRAGRLHRRRGGAEGGGLEDVHPRLHFRVRLVRRVDEQVGLLDQLVRRLLRVPRVRSLVPREQVAAELVG